MSYLADTRYATEALFTLINADVSKLAKQQEKLSGLKAKSHALERNYLSMDLSEDFSDVQLMNAGAQAHAAFQDTAALSKEIDVLQREIDDREFARRALCGAVLQIAKQGIHSSYSGYETAPRVRWFGKVHLAQVIWEARNQAMHYEGGPLDKPRKVFEELNAAGLLEFNINEPPCKNRALEILVLLGWQQYADYERDMTALLVR